MTRRSFAKRLAVFAIAAKFSMLFDLAPAIQKLKFHEHDSWCPMGVPASGDTAIIFRNASLWLPA